jgi:hypothetical protein
MLRAFAQRHEPTAIAGAVPSAAAHSASQVGTSFVLAQHFSARRHELTATAEDLVVFDLCIRSLLAYHVSQKSKCRRSTPLEFNYKPCEDRVCQERFFCYVPRPQKRPQISKKSNHFVAPMLMVDGISIYSQFQEIRIFRNNVTYPFTLCEVLRSGSASLSVDLRHRHKRTNV